MATKSEFTTIRFSVEGPVATITLARPESANAMSSVLIDELDRALDLVEEDDEVRVVILDGEGKRFCAGHDLKEILEESSDWTRMRSTPEGKLHHEFTMYWEKCLRLRDFPKPTIAAVQGVCAAAGLMLATMCDLIIAADNAKFSNPVARMTGVGVELLIEPWEMGPRKAKEFLLCATTIDAGEALRLGLAKRVVKLDQLSTEARLMADEVALVPPITAQAIKETINHTVDLQGQREAWRYHFMVHQFVSNTETALGAMSNRKEAVREEGGLGSVKREQSGG